MLAGRDHETSDKQPHVSYHAAHCLPLDATVNRPHNTMAKNNEYMNPFDGLSDQSVDIFDRFPRIRACLFDMDGLLIDSEDKYTMITNEVLQMYGKPNLPWSVKAQLQGRPQPEVPLKSFFDLSADTIAHQMT